MAGPLDEKLQIAVQTATRHRIAAFLGLLEEHRGHPGFKTGGWVMSRELGFICCDREVRISIRTLQEMMPEARASYIRLYEHHNHFGAAARRRAHQRASKKAKALLCRFLTREQRWTLRAEHYFEVVGQDGLTYTVRSGPLGGSVIQRGDLSYCFHPKDEHLPRHDLMLAQKLYIESKTADFLAEAHVTDPNRPRGQWRVDPATIPEHATVNPEPFLREAMGTP
jgi:hypothetical protein